jgi:hypothetical protein
MPGGVHGRIARLCLQARQASFDGRGSDGSAADQAAADLAAIRQLDGALARVAASGALRLRIDRYRAVLRSQVALDDTLRLVGQTNAMFPIARIDALRQHERDVASRGLRIGQCALD